MTLVRMILPPLVAIAIALGIHFGVGTYDNGYWINQLTIIGISIILAVSLNVVNGFTGQFSIGHAAFLSIGAFFAGAVLYYGSIEWFATRKALAGILSFTQPLERFDPADPHFTRGDLFFLGITLTCGLVTALIGVLVGLPARRLRGDYLAIVTVGFGEIVRILISSSGDQLNTRTRKGEIEFVDALRKPIDPTLWEKITGLGEAQGFNFIPKYGSLFWIWLFVGITIIVALRLKYSTHGRAYLSIREDEIAAEAMGIRTSRYKVQAFAISAFFAGVAGALTASSQGTINAGEMAFMRSLEIVVIVVLGGMGSVSGAIIAAIVLTYLPEFLQTDFASLWSRFTSALSGDTVWSEVFFPANPTVQAGWLSEALLRYRLIVYALILILVMILRPRGLLGTRELWDLFKRRKRAIP